MFPFRYNMTDIFFIFSTHHTCFRDFYLIGIFLNPFCPDFLILGWYYHSLYILFSISFLQPHPALKTFLYFFLFYLPNAPLDFCLLTSFVSFSTVPSSYPEGFRFIRKFIEFILYDHLSKSIDALFFNLHVLKSPFLVISMSTTQAGLPTLLISLALLVVMQRSLPLLMI